MNSGANNFGALRLALAYMVILSHSPELIDGNRSRELLTQVFGTLSFGELAVKCFFIISGYLITSSYHSSASGWQFLAKRVLRIYPGYAVAFVLCVFVLAPWVGGQSFPPLLSLSSDSVINSIAVLRLPQAPGAFAGAHYPLLNGSAWTIRYEFLAYLIVLAVGSFGLLRRLRFTACATAVLVCAGILTRLNEVPAVLANAQMGLMPFAHNIHFLAAFGCGSVFYLARHRIVYKPHYAAIAGLALLGSMFSRVAADTAVVILGGYLLLYAALHVQSKTVSRIGQTNDISYGVYLYAWPIQATFCWLDPAMNPWVLFGVASMLATVAGYASWFAVERPAMSLKALVTGARRTSKLKPAPSTEAYRRLPTARKEDA